MYKLAVTAVQAGARGMAARSLARRLRGEAAALRIQSAWRRHVGRVRFLRVRHAVLAIQAAYRGLTARHIAADLRCGDLLHTNSRANEDCPASFEVCD